MKGSTKKVLSTPATESTYRIEGIMMGMDEDGQLVA